MQIPSSFTNPAGERLDTAFTPADGATRLVVIGHGVTSHHDRPYLAAVGDACARRGIAALRLSFAGNGESEGRFEDATIPKEVDDLCAVVDACAAHARVAYVGHSMGGAVGVLAASREPRLEALVSLAGMTHVSRFVQRHFADLAPGDVMLGRDHARLSQAFLDDAQAIGDTLAAARAVSVPWLLLHGDADDLVPLADSEDAAAACDHAELVALPGIDHTFTGAHEDVAERVATWLDARWPA